VPSPKPLNKFTVMQHIVALEAEVADLQKLVTTIQLIPGPEGRPGTNGQQGLQGVSGRDGKDGAQGPQGSQGIQGPPGQSIRGECGPAGPDTITVLQEVRQEIAQLRAQVAPLSAAFERYLSALAAHNAHMAERLKMANEAIAERRKKG
jgi:hypothetical protein